MPDEKSWERNTAGARLEFQATDQEIIDVLNFKLPEKYKPYSLIGGWLEKEDKSYRESFKEIEMDQKNF